MIIIITMIINKIWCRFERYKTNMFICIILFVEKINDNDYLDLPKKT